jgi:hypothetical protein
MIEVNRIRKYVLSLYFIFSVFNICSGQIIVKTQDLFPVSTNKPGTGILNIIQDPALDTLISRYVLNKENQTESNGFRILIYRNSSISAKSESERIHAEFMSLFPEIPGYRVFQAPNYYLVLAGTFRSRADGLKLLLLINKKYPDAYFVPYLLNFDDLNKSYAKS